MKPPTSWITQHRVHDATTVLRRFRAACRALRWKVTVLGQASGYPIYAGLGKGAGVPVYVSAGVHGDEPAAVEALLQFLESGAPKAWPFRWCVVPCLNPWGLAQNRRLDESGTDLNRTFHREDLDLIVTLRTLVLSNGVPHLSLQLHEDYDAQGVYLYELNQRRPPMGSELLQAAAVAVPPDPRRRIEGSRAQNGWIKRKIKPDFFAEMGLPEAGWMHFSGAARVVTVETPSEFALERRVDAQLRMIHRALEITHQETRAV